MRRIAAWALLVLTVMPAAADEMIGVNGEKLIGKVQTLKAGKLTFRSDLVGVVTVAITQVATLTTDVPVTLVPADGTSVRMRMLAGKAGQFALEPGGPEIALASLTAINPPPPPNYPWRGNTALGLELLHNLINSSNLNLTAGVRRERPYDRITLDTAYLNARQNHVTTEESAFLNGAYDYGLQRRLYGFVNGGLRTDRIQRLQLRATLGTGVGYGWVRRSDLNFRTELGLAWLSESFTGETAENKLTGQLGYALEMRFLGASRLRHEFTFYPSLTSFGDNYLLAQFVLTQPLSGTIYYEVRYLIDYTSQPAPGAARSTSKLIIGLGKKF